MLNMFRAPLCPSSVAHYDSVGYHIGRQVLEVAAGWKLSAGRMDECPDTHPFCLHLTSYQQQLIAFGPDTHPSCLHLTSNQQQLTAFGPDTYPSCLHLTSNQQHLTAFGPDTYPSCLHLTSNQQQLTAFGPDTPPSCLHLTPNQQQPENQTAYVVTNAIVVSS